MNLRPPVSAQRSKSQTVPVHSLPVVFGVSALALTAQEHDFFQRYKPYGVMLFRRNCRDVAQLTALVKSLRDCGIIHIFIDEEGGRVQRLRPPAWPHLPAAGFYGDWLRQILSQNLSESGTKGQNRTIDMISDDLPALQALQAHYEYIAQLLSSLGITANAAPVCDIRWAYGDNIVGDRSFGEDVALIRHCARLSCEALRRHGILPVIKHLPGHGRAQIDSHIGLPHIHASLAELKNSDGACFADFPIPCWGMVGHLLIPALDAGSPSSCSRYIVTEIIRETLNFLFPLISDDIAMGALEGGMAERACRVLDSGCDLVLHCTARLEEMEEIAAALRPMGKEKAEFLAQSLPSPPSTQPDPVTAFSRLQNLLSLAPDPIKAHENTSRSDVAGTAVFTS